MMKLLEYQAKQLLGEHGLTCPKGTVVTSVQEAAEAARQLKGRLVVKAQVPIGGRGKAGAIRFAESVEEVGEHTRSLLHTKVRGFTVEKALIEEAESIADEYYVSVTLDRTRRQWCLLLSKEGGIDIEESARTNSRILQRHYIDTELGLRPYHCRTLLERVGIPLKHMSDLCNVMQTIYHVREDTDALLVEVNPLALSTGGQLVVLDAKVNLDDNALFRHPTFRNRFKDRACSECGLETDVMNHGLSYVKLKGAVGVMGNGAGLVMATLDMIEEAGGHAANFLDIGGGARSERITNALRILLKDPEVNAIIVNVFGGITRGDEVAKGLIRALTEMEIDIPIVVRLAGTRAKEGRELLTSAQLPHNVRLDVIDDLTEAARRAVALSKGE